MLTSQITQYIEDVFGPTECYIQIRLDWDTINKLGLEVTIDGIRRSVIENKKLKIHRRVLDFAG